MTPASRGHAKCRELWTRARIDTISALLHEPRVARARNSDAFDRLAKSTRCRRESRERIIIPPMLVFTSGVSLYCRARERRPRYRSAHVYARASASFRSLEAAFPRGALLKAALSPSLSLSFSFRARRASFAATDCVILAEFSIILNRHGALDNHRAARCSLFIALVNRWRPLFADRTCGINASLPLHARGRAGRIHSPHVLRLRLFRAEMERARTLARINHAYRGIGISK